MSKSDEEIVRRALLFQKDSKDYSLFELPGYSTWASQKLEQGESEVIIAHLDAMAVCLLPQEAAAASEALFEEMLAELKFSLGK